jgi:hypothetical protein
MEIKFTNGDKVLGGIRIVRLNSPPCQGGDRGFKFHMPRHESKIKQSTVSGRHISESKRIPL